MPDGISEYDDVPVYYLNVNYKVRCDELQKKNEELKVINSNLKYQVDFYRREFEKAIQVRDKYRECLLSLNKDVDWMAGKLTTVFENENGF